MTRRTYILTDGCFPEVVKRIDYNNFINYLIGKDKVDYVICGNYNCEPVEKINKATILRTPFYTKVIGRLSEIQLSIFQIKQLSKLLKKGDNVIIIYYSMSFLVHIFSIYKGALVTAFFFSVPIKHFFIGKVFRTFSLLLSKYCLLYMFEEQKKDLFIFVPSSKRFFTFPVAIDIPQLDILTEFDYNNLRKHLGLANENIKFIIVSTIDKTRKVLDVAKAFYKLSRKYANISLIIVGDGDELNEIIEYKNSNKIKNIIITGAVERDFVFSLYSIANVGITYYSKTIYNYQPALKTMEYLFFNLPTIAVSTLGNSYFIDDGKNGFLIEDNIADLFNKMEKYIIEPELFLRQKGYLSAEDKTKYSYQVQYDLFFSKFPFIGDSYD